MAAAILATLGVVVCVGASPQAAFAAPVIGEESTVGVSQTAATLQAEVNPNGSDTQYRFEYGPSTSYEKSIPVPDKDIGTSPQTVSALATGLVSGGTYHFRVVASNSEGTNAAPDFVFTTHSAPSSFELPDKRSYELVTPIEKTHNSGDVRRMYFLETSGFPVESSPSGNAVTYIGEGFYEALSGNHSQEYLSTRGADGWATTNLMSSEPFASLAIAPYVGLSASTATGVVTAGETGDTDPLASGVPEGYANDELYLRSSDGIFTPLITVKPPNRAPEAFGRISGAENRTFSPLFVGAAGDFSRVFFEANDALTANAVDGGPSANNLYEWSAGELRLVNVLPDGSSQAGASAGAEHGDRISPLTTTGFYPNLDNAISQDGSRVFWTDETNGNLYMRERASRTVQVDAAVGGGGEFQTANTEGSKVFFTKAGDLYEYELESGQTIDLTPDGQVQGLVGTSNDGSFVYFVAQGVLAAGASPGQDNLYLEHAGTTSHLATLAPADNELATFDGYFAENGSEAKGVWSGTFAGRAARVSPDGRYLAFASTAKLTNHPPPGEPGLAHGVSLAEIYLYDAVSGDLQCASCRSDGQHPSQPAWLPVEPGFSGGLHQPRWLNDNGQVFFFSEEELAPGAPQGGLYEYEDRHDYLLAAGPGGIVSFVDASESGNDVFFRTTEALVPQDQDQLGDIYDARVDGGFPPPIEVPCVADACHGEPTPPFP